MEQQPVLLHRRIREYVEQLIDDGVVGDRLPSIADLSDHFGGTSTGAVQQALQPLKDRGLVITTQGRGGGHFIGAKPTNNDTTSSAQAELRTQLEDAQTALRAATCLLDDTLELHYRNVGRVAVAAANAEAMIGALIHVARGNDLWPGDDTWLRESVGQAQAGKNLKCLIAALREATDAAGPEHERREGFELVIGGLERLKIDWDTCVDQRHKLVHSIVTVALPFAADGSATVSEGDPVILVQQHPKTGTRPLLDGTTAGTLAGRLEAVGKDATRLIAEVGWAVDALHVELLGDR